MKRTYRSALGKQIDMDSLRLSHEATIAIGNMKVNARGDELGPGGEVLRSRNQVMDDYYRLNDSVEVRESVSAVPEQPKQEVKSQPRVRGSAARRILDDQDGVA